MRSSTTSMEFWGGVGLLWLAWATLNDPNELDSIRLAALICAAVYWTTFCVCRTLVKIRTR